jgi:hypothetical protein
MPLRPAAQLGFIARKLASNLAAIETGARAHVSGKLLALVATVYETGSDPVSQNGQNSALAGTFFSTGWYFAAV